jgi:hypothetical protein
MAYQDIPDFKTQIALNKVRGITPNLTPAEQLLFVQQQYLESEKQRIAQEKGLPNILGGDVRSYTGSMFAPAGSPMAAVPIPQGAPRVGEAGGGIDVNAYRGSMFGEGVMGAAPVLGGRAPQYNPNVSADAILGRAFGKRPAGQVSYAPATPAAPQTFTQGQQTPRGSILGMGESVTIGQPIAMAQPTRMTPQAPSAPIMGQSYQGVPDMTGGYEAMAPSPISPPSMAAPAPISRPQVQPQPIQPSILGGSVVAMPQQAPTMAPMLGAFQPGSQEYSYLQQRGAAPQTLGYAAQAAAASPYMQQLGMQQQQFAAAQQERQTKQLLDRAANDFAAGNPNALRGLPPELQTQAYNAGLEIQKKLAEKPESLQRDQVKYLTEDFKAKNGREPSGIEMNAIIDKVRSSTVPKPPEQESAFATKMGEQLAVRQQDAVDAGNKSYVALENINNVKANIAAGAEQGPVADVKLMLMNAANAFLSPQNQFDTSKTASANIGWNEITLATAEKMQKQGSITNSEREQAKATSAKITTEKEAALFNLAFQEANHRRKIMIAEKLNDLRNQGITSPAEYAKAMDIRQYPSLDDKVYGDYGTKLIALGAAAEKARRAAAKGTK